MALTKIVSSGQPGVNRAALDAALALGFPCGGWGSADPGSALDAVAEQRAVTAPGAERRELVQRNVRDSDGTVIFFNQTLTGGTKRTRDLCIREKKPFIVLDAAQIAVDRAVKAVLRFIDENEIQVLHVAGPRAGGWAGGNRFAADVVGAVLEGQID
jgi:hypothetical protein